MLIPVMRLAYLISSGGRQSLGVRLGGGDKEFARVSEDGQSAWDLTWGRRPELLLRL